MRKLLIFLVILLVPLACQALSPKIVNDSLDRQKQAEKDKVERDRIEAERAKLKAQREAEAKNEEQVAKLFEQAKSQDLSNQRTEQQTSQKQEALEEYNSIEGLAKLGKISVPARQNLDWKPFLTQNMSFLKNRSASMDKPRSVYFLYNIASCSIVEKTGKITYVKGEKRDRVILICANESYLLMPDGRDSWDSFKRVEELAGTMATVRGRYLPAIPGHPMPAILIGNAGLNKISATLPVPETKELSPQGLVRDARAGLMFHMKAIDGRKPLCYISCGENRERYHSTNSCIKDEGIPIYVVKELAGLSPCRKCWKGSPLK